MTPQNLWLAFAEHAARSPGKAACIYLGTRYTYKFIKDCAEAFAGMLSSKMVERGDRVVIYAPNSPQWIIAFLGIQKIGAIAVPITPIYTPPDIKFICNNCDAKFMVCSESNLGYVLQVLPDTSVKNVAVTKIDEMLPSWKRFIGRAFDKIPHGHIPSRPDIYQFKKALSLGGGKERQSKISQEDDIAAIMYTGGTTGFPKGVPLSNAAMIENMFWVRKSKEPVLPDTGDIVLQGAPLFHILGLGGGLITPLCMGGDTVILPPRVNGPADSKQVRCLLFLRSTA